MFASIGEAGRALRTRKISCKELIESSLKTIENDTELNAFITVTAEAARKDAVRLDAELAKRNDRGPLHGIPIGLKDLFYTLGVRTTNGSKVFADFIPNYDASVVMRLKEAGAVSLGKLNMHEMAYGVTSSNPHFGSVRNPHDRTCIPGGSSGGSGAAVAAGMVLAAMGSDTGGSIRIPASYCGTVGFKPTFDLVSRYGAFPLGLTLDHIGPLTRTVADAELVFRATADSGLGSTGAEPDLQGIRIGMPSNFFNEGVDNEVAASCAKAAEAAQKAGAELVKVQVPDPAGLNVIARTVLLCEAASVLAPYHHRRADFGDDVLALLDQGTLLRATEYVQAQRIRYAMQQAWAEMFRSIDVLLTPTIPIPAPKIGQTTVLIAGVEEDTRLASTRFVRGINALGLPAISLPCGQTNAGLPIGVQLVGKAYEDSRLLCIAAGFERELGVAPLA